MNVIYFITALVILFYFIYPLWLKMISGGNVEKQAEKNKIGEVSLILLSYNGKSFLEDKIRKLSDELKAFPGHEMIIVDDYSIDGSRELLLGYKDIPGIKVILKDEHKGIPHTMNLAVSLAKYDYLIFCDQRQVTSGNSLAKLVEPLGDEETGVVSACISHIDKAGHSSWIRRYENFLKAGESQAGSLMGVYGPLYAMKKGYYSPIPEYIILDDLYLSLNVMATTKINITGECVIYDEHICSLHDYKRIRRYLTGFWQILRDKTLMGKLPPRQMAMLIWHKYMRLLIPVLLCLSYFTTGTLCFYSPVYYIPFLLLTVVGIASLTPLFSRLKNIVIHFVRINVLYVLAMADLIFSMIKPGFSPNP
jgi:poly-beta-1,6-N-acetyl-D-glucosamine synthase